MGKETKINLNLTAEETTNILAAIQTLETLLLPKLIELTSSEKASLPKMKDKTVAFVTKATEHAEQNASLVPQFLDVVQLRKDLKAVETLRQLQNPLEGLVRALNDTMILAGSDAYTSSLAFYQAIKAATKFNVKGSKEIYEDLKIRFISSNKKKEA